MPIDRLSSTASLIAALRAEMAGKKERAAAQPHTEAAGDVVLTAKPTPRDVEALRRQLAEIVTGVVPDDEESMKAVRPGVVRAVLLWEFGSELREYGEWQPMVEALVAALEADPRHRENFSRVIRELHSL